MNRLETVDETVWYEAALAFRAPEDLRCVVLDLRSRLGWPAPPEFQLEPHVTVLFLGRRIGRQMVGLKATVEGLVPARAEACLVGLGVFKRGDKIINVHLKLGGAPQLRALHRRAHELATDGGWGSQSPYILADYTPHVSIYDSTSLDAAYEAQLAHQDVRHWGGTFVDLHVIGRIVPTSDQRRSAA